MKDEKLYKMKYSKVVIFLFILTSLMSCNKAANLKEVARLPIDDISIQGFHTKETTLHLKKGDELVFFTDLDVVTKRALAMGYLVEVRKDDKPKGIVRFQVIQDDPDAYDLDANSEEALDSIPKKVQKEIGTYAIEEDGAYLFKAALMSSSIDVTVHKADLIIKQ